MNLFKKVWAQFVLLLLWLWAILPKALDWIGRTTLPDDWGQLMDERLPAVLQWLFSTPWWVPAALATLLTGWLIWASWPRRDEPTISAAQEQAPAEHDESPTDANQEDKPNEYAGHPFKSDGLYVGTMRVSLGMLDQRQVEISMTCFNGTGHAIIVRKVSGNIRVVATKDKKQLEEQELPAALVSDRFDMTKPIGSYAEFTISLEQPVTKKIADILAELDGSHSASFYLENLNVMVSPVLFPEKLFRLPQWDGVRLSRNGEQPHWGRIHTMKTRITTIGVSVS